MNYLKEKFSAMLDIRRIHLVLIVMVSIRTLGGTLEVAKMIPMFIVFVIYLKIYHLIRNKFKKDEFDV